jgi:hypothetical protein
VFVNVVAVMPLATVVHPPAPVLLLWTWNVIGPGAPFEVYVQTMTRDVLPAGAAGVVTVSPAGTAGIAVGVVAEAVFDQFEGPAALNARTR